MRHIICTDVCMYIKIRIYQWNTYHRMEWTVNASSGSFTSALVDRQRRKRRGFFIAPTMVMCALHELRTMPRLLTASGCSFGAGISVCVRRARKGNTDALLAFAACHCGVGVRVEATARIDPVLSPVPAGIEQKCQMAARWCSIRGICVARMSVPSVRYGKSGLFIQIQVDSVTAVWTLCDGGL